MQKTCSTPQTRLRSHPPQQYEAPPVMFHPLDPGPPDRLADQFMSQVARLILQRPRPAPARTACTLSEFFGVARPMVARVVDSIGRVMDARPEPDRWGPVNFGALLDACAADLGDRPSNADMSSALDALWYRPLRAYGVNGRGAWTWFRPWHDVGSLERRPRQSRGARWRDACQP